MQNARVKFMRVGQGVEFGGRHKQAGNRFGEAETGTKGKIRMPSVWRMPTASECISGDPNDTRVDSEDPERSEKVPHMHETKWGYSKRKKNGGDWEVSE